MNYILLALILFTPTPTPALATAFRAASTNSAASGTAITVAQPTGTTTGDLVIIATQMNSGTGTMSDNNGGTPFTEDIADNAFLDGTPSGSMSFWSRRMTGGEPDPFAFTGSASVDWRATAVTIASPHPTTIYDASPVCNEQSGANPITTAGITTSSDNALVVVFFLIDGVPTFSVKPSGYDERIDATTDRSHWVGTKTKTPAGAEAAQTITVSATAHTCSILLAIEQTGSRPIMPIFLSWLIDPFKLLWSLLQPLEAYAR